MQCTKPRRSSPDHPQSPDCPYPVHDEYQAIFGHNLPEHLKIRLVHCYFLIHTFLGSLQSSGMTLNPPLHFLFQNISIISIVSPILMQPSIFIIVLFHFTSTLHSPTDPIGLRSDSDRTIGLPVDSDQTIGLPVDSHWESNGSPMGVQWESNGSPLVI